MSIRLGANPIIWSNDDLPDLGANTPLETCLAQASSIGFEGMELGHKFPREASALRRALEPFGLECVSGWYSAGLLSRDPVAELALLRPHLELLKAMGSRVLVFAETSGSVHGDPQRPLSERPVLHSSQWKEFGRRLSAVARITATEGVRLAYHHHMGTVVQSERDIDLLMQWTDEEVGLLLDTGHATFAGIDPAALASKYRHRIRHVHTKSVRAAVRDQAVFEGWSFLRAVVAGVFTVPGDGDVCFEAILRELRGYSGWIILEAEQDPERADPRIYATLGYDTLRRLIAQELS